MTDTLGIISKIEHGFTLSNPFYEHNYRVTVNKIKNDFTKSVALENREFLKAFRRYSSLVKAPVDFIMHILKSALAYEKPRSSVESVKRSLGAEHTVAWCYDPKSEIFILYTSIYSETADWDEWANLRYGLLLQWRGFKLGKVEKVEIGSGKRTSLFETNCLFTSDTMRYSILKASPRIANHIDQNGFGKSIRSLIVDQVCSSDNWTPVTNFLKHHTRDYQGVDSMFVEALLKERNEAERYISKEDVVAVSKACIALIDCIVKKVEGKYHSEYEFLNNSNELKFAIIYGAGNSLYYAFKSEELNEHFFFEVNDAKRVVALYKGNPVEALTELVKTKITDIVNLSKEICE